MKSVSDVKLYYAIRKLRESAQKTVFSSVNEKGNYTVDGIAEYPTSAGVFRVTGTRFAGLPDGCNLYGTLIIFNAGGYVIHQYFDGDGVFYLARTDTTESDWIPKSEGWGQFAKANHTHPIGMQEEFFVSPNAKTYTHKGIAAKMYIVTIDTEFGETPVIVDYSAVARNNGELSVSFFAQEAEGAVHSSVYVAFTGADGSLTGSGSVTFSSNIYPIKYIRGLY